MPSYNRKVEIPGRSAQELYDQVAGDIDRFLEKTPIGDYDIDRKAELKRVEVKSKMFSANLICQDGVLALEVKLSLLAAPFKGKLDEGIDKWLAKRFDL